MKIIQNKDGSGEIVFSWKEIWILVKKRKLSLTAESLKHLSNNLVKIAIEFNENFNREQREQMTFSNKVDVKNDSGK
tara:strand:+ start:2318 stop:2548 length:231 start_codon:yes stop_codon:yes gene_type:complete